MIDGQNTNIKSPIHANIRELRFINLKVAEVVMKKFTMVIALTVFTLWCSSALAGHHNPLPSFFEPESLQVTEYDGVNDDLLSAGLNQEGLEGAAPLISEPPTAAELRRLAIYNNYRGIVDPVPAGGMGLLWGPKSEGAPSFDPPVEPGLIPGVEYKAYFRAPSGWGNDNNITMVVQIPRHFDPEKPCIVTAPPSGSRGAYGGIAVGEWGLFKGCAVALGGKGTGTGFHLLGEDNAELAVDDIDGVYGPVEEIGREAQFRVKNSPMLDRFLKVHPDRVAVKHAHSQINPERLWGQFALNSIRFAFWALNDHFKGHKFKPWNTLVIASGVSNGAGVSVRSLEDDRDGLIDGLVVSEPSINPKKGHFVIKFGDETFNPNGQTLNDSITLMGTYAGCAALDSSLAGTPFQILEPIGALPGSRANRCEALYEMGLLTADTLAGQAAEALQVLRKNGYYKEEDWGIASHEWLNLWRSLQPTYAASYGRFAVWENICNVSFAATGEDFRPAPVPEAAAMPLFATSSGIPATGGINLIADAAANGPILENLAISASTGLEDLNFDGALCFRYLSTGDPRVLPYRPSIRDFFNYLRVRKGEHELQTSGKLHGKPAIIIHGREDALVFPNFQSRAYYALNQVVEKRKSNLRYWEVTPAQHFDAFISSLWLSGDPDGAAKFVPLHFYLTEGLDMMYDHLVKGTPLPPSQVVRAEARGYDPYTMDNIGKLLPLPILEPGDDAIISSKKVLKIPK